MAELDAMPSEGERKYAKGCNSLHRRPNREGRAGTIILPGLSIESSKMKKLFALLNKVWVIWKWKVHYRTCKQCGVDNPSASLCMDGFRLFQEMLKKQ